MPTILLNGQEFSLGEHERLNVIQAAERAGVEIPYYCWHPGLSVVASCRMCLVEIGQRDKEGHVQMQPRLVPACQTPARDGTVVVTNSEKVLENRRFVQEYLLVDHPVDCPICDQAGECYLQDYYYKHGRSERRADENPFTSRRRDVGEHVALFVDRCIMCSRCVRFTREVSGGAELQVIQRGSHAEIDVFSDRPVNNRLAGNVVDICPVGALCSKDFLYQQRVWFLSDHPSVCPGCSSGCAVQVDENRDTIYRLRPRHNPNANDWWMCDDGRFGWKHVHSADRLTTPRAKVDGQWQDGEWAAVLAALRRDLSTMAAGQGRSVVGVASPYLTCEEAYLFARFIKGLSCDARLALGPVPVVGEDDAYPKSRCGNGAAAGSSTRFVIRSEKCPNRRGVEAVLQHFQRELLSFAQVLAEADAGRIHALYLTGGYPANWLSPIELEALHKLRLLVVQDVLHHPLADVAGYVLPGATSFEKDGSFVNHAGLMQTIERAVRAPGGARPDGRILWELLGGRGLYHAGDTRRELARTVPFFAAAGADIPEHGTKL
jgi:NADH-quinone oxidoreductase subunit G